MIRRKSKDAKKMGAVAEAASVASEESYGETVVEDLAGGSTVPSVDEIVGAEQEDAGGSKSSGRRRRRRKEEQEAEEEAKAAEESKAEQKEEMNFFGGDFADDDSMSFGDFGDMALDVFANDDEMDDETKAIENNAEMEILDLFKIDNDKQHMDVIHQEKEEEPEPEPEPEEEPEPEPFKIDADNVVGALKIATETIYDRVTKRIAKTDGVEIVYDNTAVPSVFKGDGYLSLANYRIYTHDVKENWDELFEVKARKGDFFEVETGVALIIPEGYLLEISVSKYSKEKYSIDFDTVVLDNVEAAKPIILNVKAEEGAYLSRIGRVIECRLVTK